MSKSQQPLLVSITEDLYFGMKIEAVAKRLDAQLVWLSNTQSSPERFLELLSQQNNQALTVLVDLSSRIGWREMVREAGESSEISWIGYGSHVEKELLAEAHKMGFSQVLARSKFSNSIEQIIEASKQKDAP